MAVSGIKSRERLIIENCTFILELDRPDTWDEKAVAISVHGYKEVIIRKCEFFVRNTKSSVERNAIASVLLYDCLKVLVEDCYFEGRTSWFRGHVLLYCTGPSTIRRVEVRGVKQDSTYMCGGGIWVANGVGEGKIGWSHEQAGEEHLMIYPPGPAIIEDCYIHDQGIRENIDAIYVQSYHNFRIRNCKLENWKEDALIDAGFRNTAGKTYKQQFLLNHGAFGMIENCNFENGYLKNSVGAAGGIFVRNCKFTNAWFMPYTFDGGGVYLIGNEFVDMKKPIMSGADPSGWRPAEGFVLRGSKVCSYDNLYSTSTLSAPSAVYISGARGKATLLQGLRSDYNIYDLKTIPTDFADDYAAGLKYKTLSDWRAASSNDLHSTSGSLTRERFRGTDAAAVPLPGGISVPFDAMNVGLTGSVGPRGIIGSGVQVKRFEDWFAAGGSGFQYRATDDAYVAKGNPTTNYGSVQRNLVKGAQGFERYTFVKVDVATFPGIKFGRAELIAVCSELGSESSAPVNISLYAVPSNAWSEDSISWNTMPAPGKKIDVKSVTTAGQKIFFDITEYFKSQISSSTRIVSFCLIDSGYSNRTVSLVSKESTSPPVIKVSIATAIGKCTPDNDIFSSGMTRLRSSNHELNVLVSGKGIHELQILDLRGRAVSSATVIGGQSYTLPLTRHGFYLIRLRGSQTAQTGMFFW